MVLQQMVKVLTSSHFSLFSNLPLQVFQTSLQCLDFGAKLCIY
ncbi:hypothetical protein FEDK69T_14740 [Flavobacterium enshiense DK69]|nr:hypothetical protein FEDK69T_14740 [Flavobacterium enshiense DK69]